MVRVFMSHSSVDKPFVERLATDLRRESIDAWLDKWEIMPGERIPSKIEEGLNNADAFILVLSPQSVNSQWVSYEKDAWLAVQVDDEMRAKQEGGSSQHRLIPVLYQDCEKPLFLKPMLHVSITDSNYEEGFQTLLRGIRGETRKPPLGGAETSVSSDPIPTPASSPGIAPRILTFKLLKSLLPAQFDEVVFMYDLDESQIPANVAQVQKAKDVILLAKQKEGESLVELLNTIYQVAPHLRK